MKEFSYTEAVRGQMSKPRKARFWKAIMDAKEKENSLKTKKKSKTSCINDCCRSKCSNTAQKICFLAAGVARAALGVTFTSVWVF